MPTELHRHSVAPFPAIAGAKRRESPPSSARAIAGAASYAEAPSLGVASARSDRTLMLRGSCTLRFAFALKRVHTHSLSQTLFLYLNEYIFTAHCE